MSDEQRFRDMEGRVHHMDKRVSLVESKQEEFERNFVDQLTLRDLDAKFDKRFNIVEGSLKELSTGFNRMVDLNEEQMRNTARREQETHEQKLLLKQAEIDKLNQEAESRKISNRIKNVALPAFQFFVAVSITVGVFWALFEFFVSHVTP